MTGLAPFGATTTSEDWVYLVGRPPANEFLSYVKAQTIGGAARDVSELMNVWRTANDRIRQLEHEDAGAADGASVGDLPAEMAPLAERVTNDPMVRHGFGVVPISLGWVELDRLVVFQKHINLRYVAELRAQLGTEPTPEDVFRFALPYDHPVPQVAAARTAANSWVLSSPSADFRLLGAELLDPSQLTGFPLTGVPAGVMGVLVGHGSNYLNVMAVEDRLIVNNGSHRAYALKESGHTHAPCIVQHVTRREELELLSEDVNSNPDRYLIAARPPMLKDYFEPQLRQVLQRPRLATQVQVSFGAQTMMVPMP